VIAIETRKTIRAISGIDWKKVRDRKEIKVAAKRFICIPGSKPVSVPARIPIIKAIRRNKKSIILG
jgi:hypothetical protein